MSTYIKVKKPTKHIITENVTWSDIPGDGCVVTSPWDSNADICMGWCETSGCGNCQTTMNGCNAGSCCANIDPNTGQMGLDNPALTLEPPSDIGPGKMKKSQLRKIVRESIKQLLNEQGAGLGWVNHPPYEHLDYAVFLTSCPCDEVTWKDGRPFCNVPVYDYGYSNWASNAQTNGVPSPQIPGGSGNPQNINIGDIVEHGSLTYNVSTGTWTQGGNPTHHVIMSKDWWDCSANDPNVNGNPSSCPNGGSTSPLYFAAPGTQCGSSWNCNPLGDHRKFGHKCIEVPGGSGQFSTKQECLDTGCEGIGSGDNGMQIDQPFSPMTTNPQSKITAGCVTDADCEEDACCVDGYCEQCEKNTEIKESTKGLLNEQQTSAFHVWRGHLCDNAAVGNSVFCGGSNPCPHCQVPSTVWYSGNTIQGATVLENQIAHGQWSNAVGGAVPGVLYLLGQGGGSGGQVMEYLGIFNLPSTPDNNGVLHLDQPATLSSGILPNNGYQNNNPAGYTVYSGGLNPSGPYDCCEQAEQGDSSIDCSSPVDYGWHCKQKKKFKSKCVQGNAQNPGPFPTHHDCMMSGCEGMYNDGPYDDLTVDPGSPVSPVISPPPVKPVATDDPFSGAGGAPDFPSKPGPLQERFQKLANISKK